MKTDSWKILIIGFCLIAILIFIKQLFLPKGILSFFISLAIVLIVVLYISDKIKYIENS